MKEWLTILISVGIVISLLELFIPKGKTNEITKIILCIILILSIIKPLLNLDSFFSFNSDYFAINYNESLFDEIINEKIYYINKKVLTLLKIWEY